MPLQFPEELIFGIPEIDQQHRDLFDMYNNFSNALESGQGKEGVYELFSRLKEFTASHFRYEERLIRKSNYPNAELHLQEHLDVLNDLKQFKAIIYSEEVTMELLLAIKRRLIRLLVNHTKNCDLRLCRHLQGHQVEHLHDAPSVEESYKIKRLGDILVDSHIISRYTLELALEKQSGSDRKLGEILIGMGAARSEDVIEACAIQLGFLQEKPQETEKGLVV